MHSPSSCSRRAGTQNKPVRSIVPSVPAQKQYLEERSLLLVTSEPERSLPSLTDVIEFLERIERSHPFIQRIAFKLYSWVKGVDQLHLHQIARIRFELAGGAR